MALPRKSGTSIIAIAGVCQAFWLVSPAASASRGAVRLPRRPMTGCGMSDHHQSGTRANRRCASSPLGRTGKISAPRAPTSQAVSDGKALSSIHAMVAYANGQLNGNAGWGSGMTSAEYRRGPMAKTHGNRAANSPRAGRWRGAISAVRSAACIASMWALELRAVGPLPGMAGTGLAAGTVHLGNERTRTDRLGACLTPVGAGGKWPPSRP